MLQIAQYTLTGLYAFLVCLLFMHGINIFYLTYLAVRSRRKPPPNSLTYPTAEWSNGQWPSVTVQLPIYNELYVVERLIDAAAQIDYPRAKFEIQVLDDSTDETRQIAAQAVKRWRARGVDIVHIQRTDRQGYKAGALAAGLARAKGEFIAIFDADFLPTPDFLRHTIPQFQDENIAFVQTRWGHTNANYSLLTSLQSLAIDAHFTIEQFARANHDYWFNFNGTAGVWRQAAIEDAGGWRSDTLTEDLDLSYRAHLKGWRAVYLRDVVVPAEIPVEFNALRRQQHRWARGSLECALRLLPQVWRSDAPLPIKIQSSLHLTGYGVHLLLGLVSLLYPAVILLGFHLPISPIALGVGLVFNLTAFAPSIYFIVAQQQLGKPWWRLLPRFLLNAAFGSGMMLNTMRAALHILRGKVNIFERTPKFGITHKDQTWFQGRYRLKLDPIVYAELGFGLYNLGSAVLGITHRHWAIAFFASLFGSGLLFVSIATILQTFERQRQPSPRLGTEPDLSEGIG